MLIRLHGLRKRGWPIPKYQFAFKRPIKNELALYVERDALLNRHTRIARLRAPTGLPDLNIPPLLDARLVELSACRMILSGIERHEDILISKVEDFTQTWDEHLQNTRKAGR